jgi:aminotransferase
VRALTAAVEAIDGVNMGQGSNLLPTPGPLIEAAYKAMLSGYNTYSIQEGIPELRTEIAQLIRSETNLSIDLETELRITSGATGAIFSSCRALLEPGAEAIVLEPYYPYHLVSLLMTGCSIRYARLEPPEWRLDLRTIEQVCTQATRVLILCNPCNPSCRVYKRDELGALLDFCAARNIVILCDEVYGTLTYDGHQHTSIASLPGAQDHVITITSFSKSHAITGWRLGYMYGPEDLIERITLVHDGLFVCAPRPLQHAMADVLADHSIDQSDMQGEFSWRRDLIVDTLRQAGFSPLPVEGTYYVLAGYSERYGAISSADACARLLKENRIATVPVSTFYHDGYDSRLLRFCYALPDSEIRRAINLLGSGT